MTRPAHPIRRLALMIATAAGASLAPATHACATCFGRSDSPLAEGMNMGILVLLGVIGVVLVTFASFFVYLARRSAALATTAVAPAPASAGPQTPLS